MDRTLATFRHSGTDTDGKPFLGTVEVCMKPRPGGRTLFYVKADTPLATDRHADAIDFDTKTCFWNFPKSAEAMTFALDATGWLDAVTMNASGLPTDLVH